MSASLPTTIDSAPGQWVVLPGHHQLDAHGLVAWLASAPKPLRCTVTSETGVAVARCEQITDPEDLQAHYRLEAHSIEGFARELRAKYAAPEREIRVLVRAPAGNSLSVAFEAVERFFLDYAVGPSHAWLEAADAYAAVNGAVAVLVLRSASGAVIEFEGPLKAQPPR